MTTSFNVLVQDSDNAPPYVLTVTSTKRQALRAVREFMATGRYVAATVSLYQDGMFAGIIHKEHGKYAETERKAS